MLEDIWTLLVFVVVFCLVCAYRKTCKPKNFPPGPPTTPFIGNCSIVRDNKFLHKTFMDLKNKYGPIFSLQLGWYPAVVISSSELLKEAFVKRADQFSNRANHIFMLKLFKLGDKGIVNTHGEIFKASKRMTMTALRDFGVGKASNEMIISEEVSALLEEIGEKKSKPFQFGALLNKVSCNIICSTLFSKRFDYNDPEYVELLTKMAELFEHSDFTYSVLVPFCLPLLFLHPASYKQVDLWNHIVGFVNKEIKEHRQSFDAHNIRDFVDIFIDAEQKNTSKTDSSITKTDSDPAQAKVSIWTPVSQANVTLEQNIVAIILELFAAGTETTGTTLMWAMAYMIKHPEIQQKCRDEIFQVVGKGGRVSLKDRKELPYVEATICEVQRIGNILPIALMHCTNGPVEFHGYSLPANTIVIPNTYAIHMDPKEWRNPEEFDPTRFLNSEGNFVKHASFMPFSIGQRACPGEGLARAELFLLFTSLLQNYAFTAPDISKIPTFKDATMGTTLVLPVYDVIATPL